MYCMYIHIFQRSEKKSEAKQSNKTHGISNSVFFNLPYDDTRLFYFIIVILYRGT